MPVPAPDGSPPDTTDRRLIYERRLGERRARPASPGAERRWNERRVRAGRRETPAGHLRNALQVLLEANAGAGAPERDGQDLDAAATRLRLAVGEIERLEAGFRRLGMIIRRARLEPPPLTLGG